MVTVSEKWSNKLKKIRTFKRKGKLKLISIRQTNVMKIDKNGSLKIKICRRCRVETKKKKHFLSSFFS